MSNLFLKHGRVREEEKEIKIHILLLTGNRYKILLTITTMIDTHTYTHTYLREQS